MFIDQKVKEIKGNWGCFPTSFDILNISISFADHLSDRQDNLLLIRVRQLLKPGVVNNGIVD